MGKARSRAQRLALVFEIVGALMVVVGGVLFFTAPPVSFGWFAYAPLSETSFAPSMSLMHPQAIGGGVTAVVGLALLAVAVGWLWGNRSSRR